MYAELEALKKRPYTHGLDPGLKAWLKMRRELAESQTRGDHEHVIRTTKYKYRTFWRAEMHERILPEMMRTDKHSDIVTEISRHIDYEDYKEYVPKLKLSFDTKNYDESIDPLSFPNLAAKNLKQAAIADDMKAILIQSHEFGLKKKLDFYWISPNLIIDRKSQQRMMHFVCFNGDLKKAEILLDRGAKLNVRDVHGNTPLMMSIQGPKMFHPHELVKLLIDNGAKIDMADNRGFTPLHKACLIGELELIEILLIRGARVDKRDKKNKFAIEYVPDSKKKEAKKIFGLNYRVRGKREHAKMWAYQMSRSFTRDLFKEFEQRCPVCKRHLHLCQKLNKDNLRYWKLLHNKVPK